MQLPERLRARRYRSQARTRTIASGLDAEWHRGVPGIATQGHMVKAGGGTTAPTGSSPAPGVNAAWKQPVTSPDECRVPKTTKERET